MLREWGQGSPPCWFYSHTEFFYSHADLTNLTKWAASNSFGEINLPSSQPTLSYRVGSQPVGLQPSVCSRTVARAKRLASVRFVRSV